MDAKQDTADFRASLQERRNRLERERILLDHRQKMRQKRKRSAVPALERLVAAAAARIGKAANRLEGS